MLPVVVVTSLVDIVVLAMTAAIVVLVLVLVVVVDRLVFFADVGEVAFFTVVDAGLAVDTDAVTAVSVPATVVVLSPWAADGNAITSRTAAAATAPTTTRCSPMITVRS